MWESFGEGNGTPLQYSCLESPIDGGAWWAAVHRVAKSQTWLSDFTFTFHFHALEKEMATHSSVLPWRIPGMAEPGGLPSMGSHRGRHDWRDSNNNDSNMWDLSSLNSDKTCVTYHYHPTFKQHCLKNVLYLILSEKIRSCLFSYLLWC